MLRARTGPVPLGPPADTMIPSFYLVFAFSLRLLYVVPAYLAILPVNTDAAASSTCCDTGFTKRHVARACCSILPLPFHRAVRDTACSFF